MPPILTKQQKVALAVALMIETKNDKKARTIWSKKWLLERKRLSHMTLLKELDTEDFAHYMRMDANTFGELSNLVKPHIMKQDTVMRESISVEERLIATLQYLATGRDYKDLRYSTLISHQQLSKIIPETCAAICNVLRNYIQLPKTEEEWMTVAKNYENMWQFNHCIGSMDGKHIQILKPPGSGSLYYNYKGSYSVVLFAIVNANYEVIYVHTGTNGSASDGGILKSTNFYKKLELGQLKIPRESTLPNTEILAPYVFIGDSAFAQSQCILKPYPQNNLTKELNIFNYRLSRARRVVENFFGILAARFHIFQKPIKVDIKNVDKIVMASCYLHNYLSQRSKNYITPSCVDYEDTYDGSFREGQWRQGQEFLGLQHNQRQQTEAGKRVRNIFKDYFNGPGKINFQNKMVNFELN